MTKAEDAMQGLWELGDLKRFTLLIEGREGCNFQAILSIAEHVYPYGWNTYVSICPDSNVEDAILEVLEKAKVGF